MVKIELPSFLHDEFKQDYIEANIKCINDLKSNLTEEQVSFSEYILDPENMQFKKHIRFILNGKLLNSTEYDRIISENDELVLLVQITGG